MKKKSQIYRKIFFTSFLFSLLWFSFLQNPCNQSNSSERDCEKENIEVPDSADAFADALDASSLSFNRTGNVLWYVTTDPLLTEDLL